MRERRKLRDRASQHQVHSELLLQQVQREAAMAVQREEREAQRRAALEEELVNQQVDLLRGQMREQHRASYNRAIEQSKAIETELKRRAVCHEDHHRSDHSGLHSVLGASAAVLKAEEVVKEEKKRQRTRVELVQQLEEVEVLELREEMRLLYCCFSLWQRGVVERGAGLKKAVVVREWRLVATMWGGWRRALGRRRDRRERDLATREAQRRER